MAAVDTADALDALPFAVDVIVACAAVRVALFAAVLAAEVDALPELALAVAASGTTLLAIGTALLASANLGFAAGDDALESDCATAGDDAAEMKWCSGPDVVDCEAVGGESARVQLHHQRQTLAAGDRRQSDAGNLREFLGDPNVGHILDLGQRQRLRRRREREDRRVGRIDLGIDRWCGQTGGKKTSCGVDRRPDLLFRDIQGQVEIELQRCHRRAGRANRAHLSERGHLAELPLERRGDRRAGDRAHEQAGVDELVGE
jgi:hypothetical protein